MAFITGIATSFSDLRLALINGCIANGWSNVGNILWKGNCFVELTAGTDYIQISGGTGQSGGVLVEKCSQWARIGGGFITLPITYDLHIFENPNEVYLVINYNVDCYQQLSFGSSNVAGGNGPWFTAARCNKGWPNNDGINLSVYFYEISAGIKTNISTNSLGLFLRGAYYSYSDEYSSSFIYTSAPGTPGWYGYGSGPTSARLQNMGSATLVAGLLNCSPSAYNSATPLLPIKATIDMGSNGRAVVVSLNHARFCRMDNIAPGDIISFGTERWKVYPWHRKNSNMRDGQWTGSDSAPPNHSGTFGYAIRYTGP